MPGWTVHDGVAVGLPLENVDTDQLIPARFMSTPRSEGYGTYLLHDLRRNDDGTQRNDLQMNRIADFSILVAKRNFGCGSSREAAVYALVDAGVRVVIAPSFGDIFAANAVNNGLLPAKVSDTDLEQVLSAVQDNGCSARIDLESCLITLGELTVAFDLNETRRVKLINGWDDIDLTLSESARIAQHRKRLAQDQLWVWPTPRD